MNTKQKCLELCSSCSGQRITCDCEAHDPMASAWTGNWPETKTDLNSLVDVYYEWCINHSKAHPESSGHYGPEVRIRVDVPIRGLAEMVEEAGYEPTPKRLDLLLGQMQERFNDKHGGCPADAVMDRILGEAGETITFIVESGDFEEANEKTNGARG
jgi:hypothetical protein